MKFIIEGKEYDAEQGIAKVTLSTLYDLKLRHGIGMKSLIEMTKKFESFSSPLEVLEDKDSLQAFRVIIWLARRHAGEKLTLDEANAFPLDSLRMVSDEPEPDPKAQTDGEAAESGEPQAADT